MSRRDVTFLLLLLICALLLAFCAGLLIGGQHA